MGLNSNYNGEERVVSQRDAEGACLCVCVCVRARARVCVCVCGRERERERESLYVCIIYKLIVCASYRKHFDSADLEDSTCRLL